MSIFLRYLNWPLIHNRSRILLTAEAVANCVSYEETALRTLLAIQSTVLTTSRDLLHLKTCERRNVTWRCLEPRITTSALPVWLAAGSDPGAPLGALIPFDEHLPHRLAAVLALWQALQGRPRQAADMTSQRRRRLLLALRALDGRDAGASYRQLAAGLFGAGRVPVGAAWKAHDLRGRTMRLVAEGIRLRDGGYRGLLRLGPRIKLSH